MRSTFLANLESSCRMLCAWSRLVALPSPRTYLQQRARTCSSGKHKRGISLRKAGSGPISTLNRWLATLVGCVLVRDCAETHSNDGTGDTGVLHFQLELSGKEQKKVSASDVFYAEAASFSAFFVSDATETLSIIWRCFLHGPPIKREILSFLETM